MKTTNENLYTIQNRIGYMFQNAAYLEQAFTRRSYSEEHPECADNEILEFIGDKVLDVLMVRFLVETYRTPQSDVYRSDKTEGDLTSLKQKLVQSVTLASRIDALGLNQYLILGRGDELQHVENDTHVKEDLFESILGAVALDSDWDMQALKKVVIRMLDPSNLLNNIPEETVNYISKVQEWCQKEKKELPKYEEVPFSYGFAYDLFINGLGDPFRGMGSSKQEARVNAAKQAYEIIKKLPAQKPTVVIDRENAINQLQELKQKKMIEIQSIYYDNGVFLANDGWRVTCIISNCQAFIGHGSGKTDAKKDAAYQALCHLSKGHSGGQNINWIKK